MVSLSNHEPIFSHSLGIISIEGGRQGTRSTDKSKTRNPKHDSTGANGENTEFFKRSVSSVTSCEELTSLRFPVSGFWCQVRSGEGRNRNGVHDSIVPLFQFSILPAFPSSIVPVIKVVADFELRISKFPVSFCPSPLLD